MKESVKESEGGERRAGVTLLQILVGCLTLGHVARRTVFISDSTSTHDLLMASGHKKQLSVFYVCSIMLCFFGGVSYDNVQKHRILFYDGLIFQSKRCAVILAS